MLRQQPEWISIMRCFGIPGHCKQGTVDAVKTNRRNSLSSSHRATTVRRKNIDGIVIARRYPPNASCVDCSWAIIEPRPIKRIMLLLLFGVGCARIDSNHRFVPSSPRLAETRNESIRHSNSARAPTTAASFFLISEVCSFVLCKLVYIQ